MQIHSDYSHLKEASMRLWNWLIVALWLSGSNVATAMADLVWSPVASGGFNHPRGSLFVRVRLPECRQLSSYYVYMQVDTGQSKSVLYRHGLDDVLSVCPALRAVVDDNEARLRLIADELHYDKALPIFGTARDIAQAPSQRTAIVLGSIGIDFFHRAYLYIDASKNRLLLTADRNKFRQATVGMRFQAVRSDEAQRLYVPAAFSIGTEPAQLLLDTGSASQNIILNAQTVTDLTSLGLLFDTGKRNELTGWGKAYTCAHFSARKPIYAAGVLLRSNIVTTCSAADADAHDNVLPPLLGLDGLGRSFKLAVNVPDRKVAVVPRGWHLSRSQ
jgi:hypothetical protein